MMQRVMMFSVAEMALDAGAIAESLNHACSARRTRYRIRGVCQVGGDVYFVLNALATGVPVDTYVLAPETDVSTAGISSMLEQRWEAGFDAIGSVDLGDCLHLFLFAQAAQP